MLYDQAVAIVMCDLGDKPEQRAAQGALKSTLMTAHRIERDLKADLEGLKDSVMRLWRDHQIDPELTPLEKKSVQKDNQALKMNRRDWLRQVYVPSLQQIGLSMNKIKALIKESRGLFYLKGDGIFLADDTQLAEIYVGNAAFEEKSDATGGAIRQIYQKKGILRTRIGKSEATEYIKDDFGRMTRRYAYVEKNYDVFKLILGAADGLSGKSVGILGTEENLRGNPFRIGPGTLKKWDLGDKQVGTNLDFRQLAHLNQEEGSTVQRAHPLSSTSKHLHGNEGYRFGRRDGVKLKIDLAKIPVGERTRDPASMGVTDQALLNLYSWDAQYGNPDFQTIGVATKKKAGAVDTNADDMKAHSDNSTRKNRELMLLRFPRDAIVQVLCHDKTAIEEVKTLMQDADLGHVAVLHEAHAALHKSELYE